MVGTYHLQLPDLEMADDGLPGAIVEACSDAIDAAPNGGRKSGARWAGTRIHCIANSHTTRPSGQFPILREP